ncbi:MAG: hypothetical protein KF685_08555 [Acidobacteria bacterium]|nr:hypothetical protein [Acidobacteriota bacterium]
MTSEELEQSLRTEFENHHNKTIEAIRHDVAEFQAQFESEFAKHKAQLDDALKALSERMSSERQMDKGFAESVVEHLRLARDEGAQITATAFGEAEKLRQESTPPAKYDLLRDAISDISSQMTQAAILKSLVEHAAGFAPRGVFFIVKNDQFAGWKVFGSTGSTTDDKAQTVRFPLSADTIAAKAVHSLGTAEGTYGANPDDELFLTPLDFGRPDRMYAIPLTARGRGVAILYADYGIEGIALNKEALETLVRVAGLTVELRAAAPAPAVAAPSAAYTDHSAVQEQYDVSAPAEESTSPSYVTSDLSSEATVEDPTPQAFESYAEQETYQPSVEVEEAPEPVYEVPEVETVPATIYEETPSYETPEYVSEVSPEPQTEAAFEYEEQTIQTPEYASDEHQEEVPAYDTQPTEYNAFESPVSEPEAVPSYGDVDPQPAASAFEYSYSEPEPVEVEEAAAVPVVEDAPEPFVSETPIPQTNGHVEVAETVSQPVAETVGGAQAKSRFSDRSIDLPIDVPEEERKLHNNARRFARLLVSEIKLYNEQKVVEGREAGDLYDRLREAIDRSREMYDKRVESLVSTKFDYFNYELVNSLADGDGAKLGSNYPGAAV